LTSYLRVLARIFPHDCQGGDFGREDSVVRWWLGWDGIDVIEKIEMSKLNDWVWKNRRRWYVMNEESRSSMFPGD